MTIVYMLILGMTLPVVVIGEIASLRCAHVIQLLSATNATKELRGAMKVSSNSPGRHWVFTFKLPIQPLSLLEPAI
jgi:hypothetical protein